MIAGATQKETGCEQSIRVLNSVERIVQEQSSLERKCAFTVVCLIHVVPVNAIEGHMLHGLLFHLSSFSVYLASSDSCGSVRSTGLLGH